MNDYLLRILMNRLSELVRGIQVDVLWVVGLDRAAWQYISSIRSEQMVLLEVLELPLPSCIDPPPVLDRSTIVV